MIIHKPEKKEYTGETEYIEVQRRRYIKELKRLTAEIISAAAAAAVIFTMLLGVTVQHGDSMYPALRDGDVILYQRTSSLVNTECCVYKAAGELHTGRVAATGGSVISATGDMQLTFDGLYLPPSRRDGIYDRTYAAEGEKLPVTVKEGCYFVLADNRATAMDSRIYGPIMPQNIRGRVIAVLRRRQI